MEWLNWIMDIMDSEPMTADFLKEIGEDKFVEQVLKDIDPKREKGKAYSSASTAIKAWKSRIKKGYGNR